MFVRDDGGVRSLIIFIYIISEIIYIIRMKSSDINPQQRYRLIGSVRSRARRILYAGIFYHETSLSLSLLSCELMM